MNTTTKSEIIARRSTFDGIRVYLWSNGDITDGAGRGVTRARISVPTAFVVVDDVAIFTWAELPAVIKAAAKAERAKLDAVGIRLAIRAVFAPKSPKGGGVSPRRRGIGRPHRLSEWRAHLEICRAFHCKVCG